MLLLSFANRTSCSLHSNTSGLSSSPTGKHAFQPAITKYQASAPTPCSVCWHSTPTISFFLQVCSFVHQNKLSRMRSIIRLSDLLPPRAHLMMLRRIERHSFLPNLGHRVGIEPTYVEHWGFGPLFATVFRYTYPRLYGICYCPICH